MFSSAYTTCARSLQLVIVQIGHNAHALAGPLSEFGADVDFVDQLTVELALAATTPYMENHASDNWEGGSSIGCDYCSYWKHLGHLEVP